MASGKFHNFPADQSSGENMSKNWELKDEKKIHDNVFKWKIWNLAQTVFSQVG